MGLQRVGTTEQLSLSLFTFTMLTNHILQIFFPITCNISMTLWTTFLLTRLGILYLLSLSVSSRAEIHRTGAGPQNWTFKGQDE